MTITTFRLKPALHTFAVLTLLLISTFDGRAQSQGAERPARVLLVLDAATELPIPDCKFRFEDWRPATTEGGGIYRFVGDGLDTRLRARVPLLFWHPSYEIARIEDYELDPDGIVTVSLHKGGTASLKIDVAALYPDPEGESQYRVSVRPKKGGPVRQMMSLSSRTSYRFSGLAAGR
jgi:hypothetical protein